MASPAAIARALETVARWIVIAAASVMIAAAILQVVFRYGVGHPLGWTEELARIMMVWWTFLAVGLLAARRSLLSVDALLLVLPARGVHTVLAFAHIVTAVFMAWLAWLGAGLVELAGTQRSPALQIPYAAIYLSLPVGMASVALASAINAGIDLRRLVRGDPADIHVSEEAV